MCGRAKLESDVSEIKIAFRIPPYPTPNFAPSWNVAPTNNLPIVRYDAKAGSRTLDLMRWGLVPYWAKNLRDRVFDHQYDGRDRRHQAGLPGGIPAPPMRRTGRQLL
jgi:putative SOS response-associated peptidase YedK